MKKPPPNLSTQQHMYIIMRINRHNHSPNNTLTMAAVGIGTRQQPNNIPLLPSQIAFVPNAPNSDLYGAVNCCSPASSSSFPRRAAAAAVDGGDLRDDPQQQLLVSGGSGITTSAGGGGATKSSASSSLRLKLGPPLLEIRRLRYSFNHHMHDDNNHHSNYHMNQNVDFGTRLDDANGDTIDDHSEARFKAMQISSSSTSNFSSSSSSLVHHETVLISRGIPGLGGNVSSTCLDFRPCNYYIDGSSGDAMVRCATGLSSGALCVHSLSNLHYNDSNSRNNDTQHPPSSTVAHYAPRQQRPATSVAWRPSNGGGVGGNTSNLVAVGLVGSGNYGVFSSSIGEEEDVAASVLLGGRGQSERHTVDGSSSSGGSIYSARRITTLSSHVGGVIGASPLLKQAIQQDTVISTNLINDRSIHMQYQTNYHFVCVIQWLL